MGSKKDKNADLHRLAINEQGSVGIILYVHLLGATTVYMGIPMDCKKGEKWVSLSPTMLTDKISPDTLIDMAMAIVPKDAVGRPLRKGGLPGGTPIGVYQLPPDAIPPFHLSVGGLGEGMDIKDLFDTLLGGAPAPPSKLPDASDYQIDNDEDSPNNPNNNN